MFRLDINALRFLAVTSVVLFHFKIPYTSGGYSGVDIFFVISGYLMHHMLTKEDLNTRTIFSFYRKRFTRIYPALTVFLLIFSIISTISSPLSVINDLIAQTASAFTFSSNLYFTHALSSYFSQTADSYIFLHTWSLGLEFQYYLIFPLILVAIKRIKINEGLALVTLAAASLILCLGMLNYNQTIAFYNLPFRSWELFIGAFASSIGHTINFKSIVKKIIELACICGIIAYVIWGGSPESWPNVNALIPTMLTFTILIINCDNADVTLKDKYTQSIGRWSYSIYLYHWPLASILITHNFDNSQFMTMLALVASVILGGVSYKFIESNKRISKKVIAASAILAILTPLFAKYLYTHIKWMEKNDLSLDSYSKYDINPQFNGGIKVAGKSCFLSSKNPSIENYDYDYCTHTEKDRKTILLFGDSHVAEFSKAIREKYWNYNIIQATASGCPSIVNAKGGETCMKLFNMVFDKIIKEKNIDLAIVGSNWSAFENTNDIMVGINKTNELLRKTIPTVKFISQTKNYASSLPVLIMNSKGSNSIIPLENSHLLYKKMKENLPAIDFIDLYDYGCTKGHCDLLKNNIPMFFDNNHYTYEWTKDIVNDKF